MTNIGRIIKDNFCNRFIDCNYDMAEATIIAEGESWIVCKKRNGMDIFISFQSFGENEMVSGFNIITHKQKQKHIDSWCRVSQ